MGALPGRQRAGGLVNYLVYATLVTFSATAHTHPVLGVAAGSLAGMVFNFTISKLLVFRREDPDPPPPAA